MSVVKSILISIQEANPNIRKESKGVAHRRFEETQLVIEELSFPQPTSWQLY